MTYLSEPYTPQPVTDLLMAFPANVEHLMPDPANYSREVNDWTRTADRWFARGLPTVHVEVREGINAEDAYRHLYTILRSFEPRHEHKIWAIATLLREWFTAMAVLDPDDPAIIKETLFEDPE